MFLLSFLVSLSLATDSLPLDDTYHRGQSLANGESVEYLVQGNPDEAAILLVTTTSTKISVQSREFDSTDYKDVNTENSEREDNYETRKITHPSNSAFYLKLTCSTEQGCEYTLRNVHTQPVYRISAVLGAFSLFTCLFLLVFAWTIFCGACRAERKR